MVKNKRPGKGVVRSAEAAGLAPSAIRSRVGGRSTASRGKVS